MVEARCDSTASAALNFSPQMLHCREERSLGWVAANRKDIGMNRTSLLERWQVCDAGGGRVRKCSANHWISNNSYIFSNTGLKERKIRENAYSNTNKKEFTMSKLRKVLPDYQLFRHQHDQTHRVDILPRQRLNRSACCCCGANEERSGKRLVLTCVSLRHQLRKQRHHFCCLVQLILNERNATL